MVNYEVTGRLSFLVSRINTETAYIMAWNDPLNFWGIETVYTVDTAFIHGIIDRTLM